MTRSPPIRAHLDPGAERARGEQHRHRQLRHLGRRAGDARGVGLGAVINDVSTMCRQECFDEQDKSVVDKFLLGMSAIDEMNKSMSAN